MLYTAIGLQTLYSFPSMPLSNINLLVAGGVYSPGMSDDPLGISRSSAAGFILGGVANVLQGGLQENAPPVGTVVLFLRSYDRDPLHACVKRIACKQPTKCVRMVLLAGKPPPERPERAQGKEPVRFDGVPADRHTTGLDTLWQPRMPTLWTMYECYCHAEDH